jgi:hypothetical protein
VISLGNIESNLLYVTTDLGDTALRSNKRARSEEYLESCVGKHDGRYVATFNYPTTPQRNPGSLTLTKIAANFRIRCDRTHCPGHGFTANVDSCINSIYKQSIFGYF